MKKPDYPLSPHLQIYKPQITSVLSIMHRISGFSLTITIFLVVLGISTVAIGESYYYSYINLLTSFPVKLIFFPVIFAFFYHMLNGIRHIFWDLGFLISNRSTMVSGLIVLFVSLVFSIFTIKYLGLI